MKLSDMSEREFGEGLDRHFARQQRIFDQSTEEGADDESEDEEINEEDE